MKWTVLSDNRTDNPMLVTEHGLSILLETEHFQVLLDTGASDVFVRNAQQLCIDLSTVDYVFLSHGHSDHAGGLKYLMELNNRAKIIVSPRALTGHFFSKRHFLHSITTEWPAIQKNRLLTIDESCTIADELNILAHIPRRQPVPKGNQNLMIQEKDGTYKSDDFQHELALYTAGILFTGCAHSGLENMLEACPSPVHTVVGGYHLLDGYESPQELTELAMRLKKKYPQTQFYTSHCTGDGVFEILQKTLESQIHAFRCGMTITL